jgi:NAD(P)-dependent dehydrogenase (short-subunit alcohol dehydrogenase family)
VINNAGFLRPDYFENLTAERIRDVIDVHLLAGFWVTQPAWRVMKERGYGRVVMTSSSSGMFAHQATANYTAAKAGLYGLMKALAFEGREHGIKVNAVLPGALGKMQEGQPLPDWDKYFWKDYRASLRDLFGERGQPERVADLVTYLVSRECPVTGEAFSAFAGRYARVFVGLTRGWFAPDPGALSAEEVRDHFDEIRDLEGFGIPMWSSDEVREIMERARTAPA